MSCLSLILYTLLHYEEWHHHTYSKHSLFAKLLMHHHYGTPSTEYLSCIVMETLSLVSQFIRQREQVSEDK